MALETGTYISDLVITNPTADDLKSQGDDHLRLLKSTIKTTFPSIVGAVSASDVELSYVKGVTSAIQTQIDTKFAKAGGILTGPLTLSPVAAAAQAFLNKPAGAYNNALTGQTAGLARWLLELGTATSEAGSNAGSDFALSRYSDAGALIDVPLTVSRATGAMAVSGALTVAGATSVQTPTLPTHATNKDYADKLFNAFASAVRLPRQSRTSNVALGVGDVAQFIDCSGTFAQTFSASATLASGWWAWIGNSGTGTITLTPNGAELIDGLASRPLNAGEARLIHCDGTTLRSVTSNAAIAKVINTISAFTASGTFVVPAGITLIRPYAFGAGAAGAGTNSGGGGGCAYGSIAVTPGQSVAISISAGIATVTANAVVTHTGNPASGVTAGTASIAASVTSGGAYSGGAGGGGGGAASGSPLGIGGTGPNGGGGAWGRNSSGYSGGGIGEATGPASGAPYNGGGSRRDPSNYYTDPLLAPLTGAGGTGTVAASIYSGDGGPGGGGGSGGVTGGFGGRGGTGAGGGGGNASGVMAGAGGFGGGGGYGVSGTGGAGGLGGGGGGYGITNGAGGAACVLVYY